MEKSNADFLSIARKEVSKSSKDLSQRLRKEARLAGWPKNVVNQLSVAVKSDTVVVEYPSHLEDTLKDLEYGAMDSNPKPVLRRFIKNNRTLISDRLLDASLAYLAKEEEML